jgi:hypothetical protein
MSAENTPDTPRADPRRPRNPVLPSMRELLAAKKAADAVSTPPPDPDPLGGYGPEQGNGQERGSGRETPGRTDEDRDAA